MRARGCYCSRAYGLIVLVVLELLFFASLGFVLLREYPFLTGLCSVFRWGVVLWVISTEEEPAYKISWLLLLLPFPVLGSFLFLRLGGMGVSEKERKAFFQWMREDSPSRSGDSPRLAGNPIFYYFQEVLGYSVYTDSTSRYFSSGELAFPEMKRCLQQGKHFIFLEYFIIDSGVFWGEILEILIKKQQEGVEIRILYDDVGCLFSLPCDFIEQMAQYGIQARGFHPLQPFLSRKSNQRDHRKLMIVDGELAFTGGINLADEYINLESPYGYWKDSVLLVEGGAVADMVEMYLTMWHYSGRSCASVEILEEERILFVGAEKDSQIYLKKKAVFQETSCVIVYNEIPLDCEPVAQRLLFLMLTGAKRTIYMTSPYLILDTSTERMLCHLARSGIDIQIITPGIPDKKWVFQVTRGQYAVLLKAGVRIFEFTPGFLHGKNVIVDGEFATVSSINLDFRSLFLHFEHGVFLHQSPCIEEMEEDFLATMAQSREVFLSSESLHWGKHLLRKMLRLFSPLM